MLPFIILISSTIFFCAIPIKELFNWLISQTRGIHDKMDKPIHQVETSFKLFINLIVLFLTILKGYLPLYFERILFDNSLLKLLIVALILIAHNWSFFNKFSPKKNFFLVLLGIYAFIFPWLIIIYPLIYSCFTIILNSFFLGTIASIILLMFFFAFGPVEPIFLAVNFVIFLVIFLALITNLIQHIEKKRWTLLHSYQNRTS